MPHFRERFLNSSESIDRRMQYYYPMDIPTDVIPGMGHSHKYGFNPDIDQVHELINAGGAITVPTLARVHNVKSSDALDVGNCQVWGVNELYQLETEIVDVNGTGGNDTDGQYFFIHRKKYLGHGAGDLTTNVGTITATADTDTTITSTIAIGAGQTQVCQYLVPLLDEDGGTVHAAMLANFTGGVTAKPGTARDLTVQLWERPLVGSWAKKEAIVINTADNLNGAHVYMPWEHFDPQTWLRLTAIGGANDNAVFGTFSLVLDAR